MPVKLFLVTGHPTNPYVGTRSRSYGGFTTLADAMLHARRLRQMSWGEWRFTISRDLYWSRPE